MRTHTYSIAVAHLVSGSWTVAIVQTTLQRGVIVRQELACGPMWCSGPELQRVVSHELQHLQDLVRQDEADQPPAQ